MNIAAMERDLAAKKGAIEALLTKQMEAAQNEERERTDDERKDVDALMAEARSLKARIDHAKGDDSIRAEMAKWVGSSSTAQAVDATALTTAAPKSLGEQFVASEAMTYLQRTSGKRIGAWSTPGVELMATTLDTSTGSGGKLIVSDYQPGILPLLFKRLVIADLIAPGTTDSNSITYMKETTFTNAAAPTSEGAAKPESTLVFDQVTDSVRKIAHFLPVTEEMLEDVAQIRSYIDQRLRLGVELAEEDQLLNGNGTPPNLQGILNRSGLTTAQARGTDSNADAVFKQITTIATAVFAQPTGIVMNPANWQTVQLTKNANGNYLGNGPWSPAQPAQLWGLPVAVTPTIASGTALVGDFRGSAQIFRKGGIRVEASNSHQDFFVKNLVAIRAEERLALAVYRPAAFGTVTGLA